MIEYKKMPFLSRLMRLIYHIISLFGFVYVLSVIITSTYQVVGVNTIKRIIHFCLNESPGTLACIIIVVLWIVHPILSWIIRIINYKMVSIQSCCFGRAIIIVENGKIVKTVIYDGTSPVEAFDAWMFAVLNGHVLTPEELKEHFCSDNSEA